MAKSICEHIRNVKSSLENAEKSFRENNGMRGELDLMLAEAEIKHLREKRGWVSVWTRNTHSNIITLELCCSLKIHRRQNASRYRPGSRSRANFKLCAQITDRTSIRTDCATYISIQCTALDMQSSGKP